MDITSNTGSIHCWQCAALRTRKCTQAGHEPCEHCQSFETWNDWASRETAAIAQTKSLIYVAIAMMAAVLVLTILPAL